MSPSKYPATRQQVYDLADRQLNNTLDAIDGRALERLLTDHPPLRRAYLEYVLLHGQLSLTVPAIGAISVPTLGTRASVDRTVFVTRRWIRWRFPLARVASLAAIVLLAVVALQFGDFSTNEPPLSEVDLIDIHYQTRVLPLSVFGTLQGSEPRPTSTTPSTSRIPATDRLLSGEQQFLTSSGVRVRTAGAALFGISSPREGTLYRGSVEVSLADDDELFTIRVGDLCIAGQDSDFRVMIRDRRRVRVQVDRGQVQIDTRDRLPRYQWDFDTPNSLTPNGATTAKWGPAARLVKGLVGTHAAAFDNTRGASVTLSEGLDDTVGSGGMSCSGGITIEALVVSNWRGDHLDYDEIFRKDDSEYRLLLSFQNDGFHGFDDPPVPDGPVLSFGLHLEGVGYRELDMPLDGQANRPTVDDIADGQPHHLVATYDSATGRKRLFVDGLLRFEQTYPTGTMILSGGPEPAQIGNHRGVEPFDGIIDEVAFYDLALTPSEVANHWHNARLGLKYFDSSVTDATTTPPQPSITLEQGESLEMDLPAEARDHQGSI